MKQFNFEKLIAHQKSLDYIDFVYDITENFPKHEQEAIIPQFRKAAILIAVNIDKAGKAAQKENINLLINSCRSLQECILCTAIAFRRNHITEDLHGKSKLFLVEILKLNRSMLASLKKVNDKKTVDSL
jgi:four helix bundle protein